VWVLFYFGHVWKPKAFDTFACSKDLVHWTKWDGPHLIEPSEPWDATYAHKPWVVNHDGVIYHFYCAVGSEGRVIAPGEVAVDAILAEAQCRTRVEPGSRKVPPASSTKPFGAGSSTLQRSSSFSS